MSLKEAQEKIDSREFAEWMCYYSIEPAEPIRGDLRSAQIASTMVNCMRSPSTKAVSLQDFLFDFTPKPIQAETPQKQVRWKLELWKNMVNEKFKAKEKRNE